MIKQIKSIVKKVIGYSSLTKPARSKGIKARETANTIKLTKGDEVIIISKKHEIYGFDMINFFDYYFTSVDFEQRGKFKVVDYSSPKFHTLKKSNVGFYFSSLPESDHSTDIYLEKLKLKEGDVVFDLGAYCGATSYFFSKQVGETGKVIAIEADPQNYEILKRNITHHNLKNVTPLHNYIWYKKDTIVFNSEGNMGSTAVSLLGRNDNTVTVSSVTLDDLIDYSGSEVAAIKIDIEGAELDLIVKSETFFKKHHPKLIIEPHFINGSINTESLANALTTYGYQIEMLKQHDLHLPLIFAY